MSQAIPASPLSIDIVSDVVCPWCIIGYLQLQKALALLPGEFQESINWHPFELNPHMPEIGQDLREHLAQKYGASPEQSQGTRSRLSELGDSLGFHFDYFDGMRMANTFKAHQLLHWAGEQGQQTRLKLALFEAFFSLQQDVGNVDVLVATAARIGLSESEARLVLIDERYAQTVRAEQQVWLDKDISAVPTFVFNNQYMVPGAQDAETFVRVLKQIKERAA
jgi:predicted DsbA family dithiol-disulfide isomerase